MPCTYTYIMNMCLTYMVELIKKVTKMGTRYIINIPNEYVQILEKNGLLGDPIKITFSKAV